MSLPIVDQKLTSESTPPPEQPSPQSTTVDVDNVTVDGKADTPSDKFYCFLPPFAVLYLGHLFVWLNYDAPGNLRGMSFVLFFVIILLFQICCLRKYEHLDSDAPPRLRTSLKALILFLTAGLYIAFVSRASELVPWPFPAVIWASAVFVVVIRYSAVFVRGNRLGSNSGALPYSKLAGNSNNNNNNNNCKEEEQYFFRIELSPEDKA